MLEGQGGLGRDSTGQLEFSERSLPIFFPAAGPLGWDESWSLCSVQPSCAHLLISKLSLVASLVAFKQPYYTHL